MIDMADLAIRPVQLESFEQVYPYLTSIATALGLQEQEIAAVSRLPQETVSAIFNRRVDDPAFDQVVGLVRGLNSVAGDRLRGAVSLKLVAEGLTGPIEVISFTDVRGFLSGIATAINLNETSLAGLSGLPVGMVHAVFSGQAEPSFNQVTVLIRGFNAALAGRGSISLLLNIS